MKKRYFLLLPLLALGACGDDNMVGLDPSVKLSDVTDEEVRELCEFQEDMVDPADRNKVIAFGKARELADNDATKVCADEAASCLALADPNRRDCSSLTKADSKLATCSGDATIGDLQTCLVDDGEWFADLAERVTCENVTAESESLPDSCVIIDSSCPDVFQAVMGRLSVPI